MVAEAVRPRVVVLDPTVEAIPDEIALAPRPAALDGLRVGLLDNGKNGVARFLDHLEALLSERYEGLSFTRARKPNASRPAPPETLDRLAAECDVVISAVGD
jgi:hypothetical protein